MNSEHPNFGPYQPLGDPTETDVIVGWAFGVSLHSDGPNRRLAGYITAHAGNKTIVTDQILANAFPDRTRIAEVIPSFDLEQSIIHAKLFMEDEGLNLALMVSMAHEIGRISAVATQLEIPHVVPPDLPRLYEPDLLPTH